MAEKNIENYLQDEIRKVLLAELKMIDNKEQTWKIVSTHTTPDGHTYETTIFRNIKKPIEDEDEDDDEESKDEDSIIEPDDDDNDDDDDKDYSQSKDYLEKYKDIYQ